MTTDKKQVTADEIVANLKEFTDELHELAKGAMVDSLIEKDEETFSTAKVIHDISHGLMLLLDGKPAEIALDEVFEDGEDNSFVGQIAVNVKTGQIDGIEDIADPKLKEQIAEVIRKLADKLGGK